MSRSVRRVGGARVGRAGDAGRARRHVARELPRGRGQPRVDADQRVAVRLVLAVGVVVVRLGGEREQLRRGRDQPCGQRELRAQQVHFGEIVLEGQRRLGADRVGQRFRVDERIAVAVAADPGAGAQERRQRGAVDAEVAGEPRAEVGVDAGNLVEERVPVVGQSVVDLVLHRELRQPQHRGLPQVEYLPVQRAVELGGLFRRQRDAVAPDQEAHDLPLGVEDALALDLGGMRREHRRHQRPGEPARQRGAVRHPTAASRSSACAMLPRCGGDPPSACARRRRFWWTSSAMLARCEK